MRKVTILVLSLVALGLVATGCAGKKKQSTADDLEQQLRAKAQEVQKLESSVTKLEGDLERKAREAEQKAEAAAAAERAKREAEDRARAAEAAAKAGSGSSSGGASYRASSGGGDLFPPDARPGECYARVIIPEETRTSTERVLSRPASERIEVIPAKYEWATERVMVKPEATKLVEVSATYKTVTEKILVSPARTVWKKGAGTGAAGRGAGAGGGTSAAEIVKRHGGKIVETRVDDTGEVMCLVEEPAKYRTVSKQVIDRPAGTKTVTIPAEYKTVKVQRLASPAREKRIPIPEKYETVTKTETISDSRIEWRPVLCQVNMTPSNISALQTKLKANGCYECQIDGLTGPCTYAGARCYARKHSLPYGKNYVTLQVIEKLGLKF